MAFGGRDAVALVTGTGGMIGAAICDALAAEGYRICGVDVVPSAAPVDRHWTCDLADIEALAVVFEEVQQAFGPIDLLVNNAGIYRPTSLLELTPDEFDKNIAVNLRAVLFGTQFAARQMIEASKSGVIINTASISGQQGSPAVIYGASKAAVINLTKSAARELGPYGIRVNAIAPGSIRSAMNDRMPDDRRRALMENIALRRQGQPEEVAGLVAFLASDAASYMTGCTVDVNGGL